MISRINQKGYVIVKDSIQPGVLQDIRKELTVKPNVNPDFAGGQYIEPYPVYQESATKLYLPRFYGLSKLGPPTYGPLFQSQSNGTQSHEERVNLRTDMVVRPYQRPIIDKTLDVLRNGAGGGVLELYTGSGKTSIAIYIMCALKVKTLIVVHKSFLLQQWVERIQQFAPTARIGVIQGTKFDTDDKDVVIGMLQTLSMKDFAQVPNAESAFASFGFVCVDETHHIGAEVFCRALPRIATRYMLGLSATPTRKDGLTKVIYWYLGETAYRLQRNGAESQRVYVKRIVVKSADPSYTRECRNFKGTIMLPQMITNVVSYEPRNALIVHEVMQYVQEAGRQVMVISDRIQHLHHLKELIDDIILKGTNTSTPERKLTTGLYTGQQKQKELNVSEKADIIFSSYAMCREGLDIQSLNTIVLATSTGDVVQTCGRILRKEHAVSPLVIDIVDNFSTFVGQSKKRNLFYKKSEYAVHSVDYTVSNTPRGLDILDLSSTDLAKLVKTRTTITVQVTEREDEDINIKPNSAYAFLEDDDE